MADFNAMTDVQKFKIINKELGILEGLLKYKARSQQLLLSNLSTHRQSWTPRNTYTHLQNPSQTSRYSYINHNRGKYTYCKKNYQKHNNRTVICQATPSSSTSSNLPSCTTSSDNALKNSKRTVLYLAPSSEHDISKSQEEKHVVAYDNGAIKKTVISAAVDNEVSPCDTVVSCHSSVSEENEMKQWVKDSALVTSIPETHLNAQGDVQLLKCCIQNKTNNSVNLPNGKNFTSECAQGLIANKKSVCQNETAPSSKESIAVMLPITTSSSQVSCHTLGIKTGKHSENFFKNEQKIHPSKRVISSKYKVVNKNLTPNKSAKLLKSPQSLKKLVKTTYKIVNKEKPVLNTRLKIGGLALRTPEAKRLIMQRFKTSLCNGQVQKVDTTASEPRVIETISDNIKQKNNSFTKTVVSDSSETSSDILKRKLLKMKCSQDFDLTSVSPEELVSLDHTSLLKLSAMVKLSVLKCEPFIKKTKYKIVTKKPSLGNKKRKWTSLPAFRAKNVSPHFAGRRIHYPLSSKKQTGRLSLSKLNNSYKKTIRIGELSYRKTVGKIPNTKVPKGDKSTVIVVRGVRFQMDASGKSLKKLSDKKGDVQTPIRRIDVGGRTYIGTGSNLYTATPSKARDLASRVLHRSIQTAVAATAKRTQENAYCMFYNRFGKCNRHADCPYIHDPSKIAVCTRFLRGTCKVQNCPFSHEKNPGKMAICSFFLQGTCKADDCPYRHEMIAPDAELCQDFVKGYCASAKECKKAHLLVCPQYFQGNCKKGQSCPYPHPPRKEKRQLVQEETITKLEPDEKVNEEVRYFTANQVEADISDFVVNRQSSSWVGQEVPNFPSYIPLALADAECLI